MNSPLDIQLVPATAADYSVVQHLCGYYVYDFTEYLGWKCPESGRFGGCDEMFAEWEAGKNYPFLIKVGGELAGFAAVGLDIDGREFYIQEFFILRKFRRRGIGRTVAYRLFDQFAGIWRVEWLTANLPATHFWQSAIEAYPEGEALVPDQHDSPWGRMHTLRFIHPVAPVFPFADLSPLRDGELEVALLQTIPSIPPRIWLPTYEFEMRADGKHAGVINLRVGNTVNILAYAGHIGYGVMPAFRGHHYAERACRLLFPLAQSHGLTTLWITTNPDNYPSRRTCERLGARLIDIVPVPEDSEVSASGDREKCRYRIELPSGTDHSRG